MLRFLDLPEGVVSRGSGGFRLQWKAPQEGPGIVTLKRRAFNELRRFFDGSFPVRPGVRHLRYVPLDPSSPQQLDTSSTISIDVRRFPWIRRLAADYAYDFAGLAPFFAGNPADAAAWSAAIARTQAQPRRRGDIASVIARQ